MKDLKIYPDVDWKKSIFETNYISRKPIYDFLKSWGILKVIY